MRDGASPALVVAAVFAVLVLGNIIFSVLVGPLRLLLVPVRALGAGVRLLVLGLTLVGAVLFFAIRNGIETLVLRLRS